jgi:hypothetical protein
VYVEISWTKGGTAQAASIHFVGDLQITRPTAIKNALENRNLPLAQIHHFNQYWGL